MLAIGLDGFELSLGERLMAEGRMPHLAALRSRSARFLLDPTFDPPGDHPVGDRVLTKTLPPAMTPEELGRVDAVLLSHDQHPDNLDRLGRAYLARAPVVLSTTSAAARLQQNVRAVANWESVEVEPPGAELIRVTGVPAQHGPDGSEHLVGEVTGFVLTGAGRTVYISGDNASLDVVRTIEARAGPFAKLTSVSLERIPDMQLTEWAAGRGTIRFGLAAPYWGSAGWGAWSPSTDPTPQFIGIDDAQGVFDRIQRAGRGTA